MYATKQQMLMYPCPPTHHWGVEIQPQLIRAEVIRVIIAVWGVWEEALLDESNKPPVRGFCWLY